jgi:hypothetical protein
MTDLLQPGNVSAPSFCWALLDTRFAATRRVYVSSSLSLAGGLRCEWHLRTVRRRSSPGRALRPLRLLLRRVLGEDRGASPGLGCGLLLAAARLRLGGRRLNTPTGEGSPARSMSISPGLSMAGERVTAVNDVLRVAGYGDRRDSKTHLGPGRRHTPRGRTWILSWRARFVLEAREGRPCLCRSPCRTRKDGPPDRQGSHREATPGTRYLPIPPARR